MKATKIYYKKLISLGNYQNEEIGIEIQIEEGEKAIDVLRKAKIFVSNMNENDIESNYFKRRKYEGVVSNKLNHSYKEVLEAETFLSENKDYEELPF